MEFHLQHTSSIPFLTHSSTQLWYAGRELSPWTQWTLWPVMTNGQAVGRGADMCLCFQPSLLRLISAPAATVGAPVPRSPQHPGLDQSTMWLRPGARRARDKQTGGRQRAEMRRKAWHTIHIYNHFIFNSICQIWWLELFIKALLLNFWRLCSLLMSRGGDVGSRQWATPPSRSVLFKLVWTIPSKMLIDCWWWALYPKAISHTDIFSFPQITSNMQRR